MLYVAPGVHSALFESPGDSNEISNELSRRLSPRKVQQLALSVFLWPKYNARVQCQNSSLDNCLQCIVDLICMDMTGTDDPNASLCMSLAWSLSLLYVRQEIN